MLLEARDWGSDGEVRVCQVWEAIEARIPRAEVRAAVDTVTGMLPPPEALPEPDWRAELARKTATVAGLCKMLTATITFGTNAQGAPVLAAMTALGEQLATDTRWNVKNPRIHPQVVTGPWKHLVFGHPGRDDGTVDRGAYIFCVLEQFCRHLKHREIYAETSARYRNPQARLLDGAEWEAVKDDVLTTLGLPEDPGALLASHVTALDEALRYVGGRLAANADVRVDDAGRIHVTSDKAIARAAVAGRSAQAGRGHAAPRRHRRADPGGDGVGAGVPGVADRPVGRGGPDGGPECHRGGLPDRPGPQYRATGRSPRRGCPRWNATESATWAAPTCAPPATPPRTRT